MNILGEVSQFEHIAQMMADDHSTELDTLRNSVQFVGGQWELTLTPPLAPILGTENTTWILGDADVAAIIGVRPISFQPVNLIIPHCQ